MLEEVNTACEDAKNKIFQFVFETADIPSDIHNLHPLTTYVIPHLICSLQETFKTVSDLPWQSKFAWKNLAGDIVNSEAAADESLITTLSQLATPQDCSLLPEKTEQNLVSEYGTIYWRELLKNCAAKEATGNAGEVASQVVNSLTEIPVALVTFAHFYTQGNTYYNSELQQWASQYGIQNGVFVTQTESLTCDYYAEWKAIVFGVERFGYGITNFTVAREYLPWGNDVLESIMIFVRDKCNYDTNKSTALKDPRRSDWREVPTPSPSTEESTTEDLVTEESTSEELVTEDSTKKESTTEEETEISTNEESTTDIDLAYQIERDAFATWTAIKNTTDPTNTCVLLVIDLGQNEIAEEKTCLLHFIQSVIFTDTSIHRQHLSFYFGYVNDKDKWIFEQEPDVSEATQCLGGLSMTEILDKYGGEHWLNTVVIGDEFASFAVEKLLLFRSFLDEYTCPLKRLGLITVFPPKISNLYKLVSEAWEGIILDIFIPVLNLQADKPLKSKIDEWVASLSAISNKSVNIYSPYGNDIFGIVLRRVTDRWTVI